ncbi:hypothetical protein F5Y06DRAFT_262072 [Hypoxylon sp. FL0890]|nr:hypothetical protein F5Y06DRAFT_262072 [Hypoxylon sp. FL0890]
MDKLQWTGRDLHRASYLAIRHRLWTEADGTTIAHDIRDSVKQSRRKSRIHQKGLKSTKLR